MVQNIVLPFWKLLAYAWQIEILKTLVCLKKLMRSCQLLTGRLFVGVHCIKSLMLAKMPFRSASAVNAIDSDTDISIGLSVSVYMIG